jgi:flagella basal body P-ring formation protein FlgA
LLLWSVILLTPYANANGVHALADIEHVAYLHAYEEAMTQYDSPQVIVEPLDHRLRLQQCDQALLPFTNTKKVIGQRSIGVKCASPTPWTVYVPVKVKVMTQVMVAARPLAARQILIQSDVKPMMVDIGELKQGYMIHAGDIIGRQLKYPIAAGTAFTSRSLKLQKVVKRGEQIILVAATSAMEVRMNGTALEDASVGQTIKVKNSSSKRVVEGVVQAPGIVKVTM